jgi:predicted transcriptional regulator
VERKNYIADVEKALWKKTEPKELLGIILTFLNFKKVEIEMYNLLLTSPMTIKGLEKKSSISERTIRKYIKRLEAEGFIIKRVKRGKRLKYVYRAVPVQEAWKRVEDKIKKILDEIGNSITAKSMLL